MNTSPRTKVLMLGWEFPPHSTGGLGVACLGLAQALTASNVDISFVLPRRINVSHDSIRLLFADVPNISFTTVDSSLQGYVTSSEYDRVMRASGGPGQYGNTLLEEVRRYALLVRDIAKRETFDIIHAHDWLSMLAGVEAKKVSGKPLIVHVHATSYDQAGGDNVNPHTYAIERYAMHEADRVVAVSGYTKNIIVQKYGVNPDKVRVVHNGVLHQSDHYEGKVLALKEAGYKIVLYLGRVTIQKGVDYFLRAAQKALQYEPDTVFVVAGTGDMEAQMLREAGWLGISDKVLFLTKFVGGEERASLLKSADIFVMPSVSEPFGLVPLEALIEGGTPVIISKQSGVSEVLRHALRVDFWDTDEMANQIVAILQHPGLAHQLSEYGREEANSVTWQKAAEKCIEIYQELTGFWRPAVS